MHTPQSPGVLLQLAHAHEAHLRRTRPSMRPGARIEAAPPHPSPMRVRLGAVLVGLGNRLQEPPQRPVRA